MCSNTLSNAHELPPTTAKQRRHNNFRLILFFCSKMSWEQNQNEREERRENHDCFVGDWSASFSQITIFFKNRISFTYNNSSSNNKQFHRAQCSITKQMKWNEYEKLAFHEFVATNLLSPSQFASPRCGNSMFFSIFLVSEIWIGIR